MNVFSLFRKNIVHIVVTGVALAIFSQVGGPFTAYAPEIFKDAGVAQDSAFLQSVIIGLILFLFTLVSIATVEKPEEGIFYFMGLLFFLVDTLAIALAFYCHMSGLWILILALVFTAVYAATVGPVTWVVLSEIFPNRIRGHAMSLATLFLWVTNFLNTAAFPVMKAKFGMATTFGMYVPIFFVYFFFVYIRIPETKGKSLEELKICSPKNDKKPNVPRGHANTKNQL